MSPSKIKFEASEVESKAACKWVKKHGDKCTLSEPNIFYTFSESSSIGLTVVVGCRCGKSKEVTDYGRW